MKYLLFAVPLLALAAQSNATAATVQQAVVPTGASPAAYTGSDCGTRPLWNDPGRPRSHVTGDPGDRLYLHRDFPAHCRAGDTSCDGTAYLVPGDEVEVGEECGDWSDVQYATDNKKLWGWVASNRLAADSAASSGTAASGPAPAEGAKPASTAACDTVADRYRRLTDQRGGAPLEALASVKDSGIAVADAKSVSSRNEELQHDENGDYEDALVDWGRHQKPPIAFPDDLGSLIGVAASVSRIPGTNLYEVSVSDGGSMGCSSSTYFEVVDGKARPYDPPLGIDIEQCETVQSEGTLDQAPAIYQEEDNFRPPLVSSLRIASWSHGDFTPACTVRFTYAPEFSDDTVNDWGGIDAKTCRGTACTLRKTAFELAAAVQDDPARARKASWERLSPAQKAKFIATGAFKDDPEVSRDAGTVLQAEQAPDHYLDSSQLSFPLVRDQHLYVASVGHYTIGWRIYEDWKVSIDEVVGGKLVPIGDFPVAMSKGRLTKVTVEPYTKKDDDH